MIVSSGDLVTAGNYLGSAVSPSSKADAASDDAAILQTAHESGIALHPATLASLCMWRCAMAGDWCTSRIRLVGWRFGLVARNLTTALRSVWTLSLLHNSDKLFHVNGI